MSGVYIYSFLISFYTLKTVLRKNSEIIFYKEKIDKFHHIYYKIWMKKMLNEGNQMHILYRVNVCDSILLRFRFR